MKGVDVQLIVPPGVLGTVASRGLLCKLTGTTWRGVARALDQSVLSLNFVRVFAANGGLNTAPNFTVLPERELHGDGQSPGRAPVFRWALGLAESSLASDVGLGFSCVRAVRRGELAHALEAPAVAFQRGLRCGCRRRV